MLESRVIRSFAAAGLDCEILALGGEAAMIGRVRVPAAVRGDDDRLNRSLEGLPEVCASDGGEWLGFDTAHVGHYWQVADAVAVLGEGDRAGLEMAEVMAGMAPGDDVTCWTVDKVADRVRHLAAQLAALACAVHAATAATADGDPAPAARTGAHVAVATAHSRRFGFPVAVALTADAWRETVAWDKGNGVHQTEHDRLSDVLHMASRALLSVDARAGGGVMRARFVVMRLPNRPIGVAEDLEEAVAPVDLVATLGRDGSGEPIVTIRLASGG